MSKAGVKTKPKSNRGAKPPMTAQTGVDIAEAGSVDKIRDILFGNQMRDFERRFSQMEERMAKTTNDLRDEIHKRLEALELFFKKEIQAVTDRLKTETAQLADADKQLGDDLKNNATAMKKAIAQVEEHFSERTTELRQDILEQSKSLSEEIQTKNKEASEALRTTANHLDDAKINRSTMAEYLIEMAMRLSDHGADASATT